MVLEQTWTPFTLEIEIGLVVLEEKIKMWKVYDNANDVGPVELENFRPTVANKSELEVCIYFFPIDKHV